MEKSVSSRFAGLPHGRWTDAATEETQWKLPFDRKGQEPTELIDCALNILGEIPSSLTLIFSNFAQIGSPKGRCGVSCAAHLVL